MAASVPSNETLVKAINILFQTFDVESCRDYGSGGVQEVWTVVLSACFCDGLR